MSFKVHYSSCKVEVPCLAEKEVVSATWEGLKKQVEVRMETQYTCPRSREDGKCQN